MFEYFGDILGYAGVAFQWLLNIVYALGFFVDLIEYAILLPVKLVAFFPPVISGAIIAFMIVWVVKGIFGR